MRITAIKYANAGERIDGLSLAKVRALLLLLGFAD
jgi:hypothetical protein